MIDKLELVLLEPLQPNSRLNISDIIEIAESNGLTISPSRSRSGERGYFFYVEEFPAIYFKAWRNGIIQRIYTNPARFSSWDQFDSTMRRLDRPASSTIGRGGWLDDAIVSRIDYAVRYFTPFRELSRGTNIRMRQLSIQMRQRSGITNALYAGRIGDQFCLYDESYFLSESASARRGRPELAEQAQAGVEFTKLERQMNGAREVARLVSPLLLRGRKLLFAQVRPHIRNVVMGVVDPLKAAEVATLSVRSSDNMSRAEAIRAARLEGSLVFAPFSDVRRCYNRDGNFDRLYAPLIDIQAVPLHERPTALLRNSLRNFLGDVNAGRIRRRRTADPAAA